MKIVLDELTELLGRTDSRLVLKPHPQRHHARPQGSGKTTAAAKLAYRLKQENHSPLLIAGDVYVPRLDQPQTGDDRRAGLPRRRALRWPSRARASDAIDNLRDVVIIDTAGRLHVDADMMEEAQAIKDATHPDQILMVVDAMTGQDVVNVVEARRVGRLDGVIMSKMDGDRRRPLPSARLPANPSSPREARFPEVFHPDRMAKRISMGDVVSLIENAARAAGRRGGAGGRAHDARPAHLGRLS